MKLVVCGDVSLQHSNDEFVKGDIELLFHDVPTAFEGADRVLINLECALTDRTPQSTRKARTSKALPNVQRC